MKTKNILIALFAILVSTGALSAATAKKATEKVVFNVSLHCESCKKKVEKNIAFEKGVKDLQVNLSKKNVQIIFDSSKTTIEKLKEALEKLSFEVSVSEPKETTPIK